MQEGRDFWWDEEAEKVQSYCPCEPVNSEDPLFILYVSPFPILFSHSLPHPTSDGQHLCPTNLSPHPHVGRPTVLPCVAGPQRSTGGR